MPKLCVALDLDLKEALSLTEELSEYGLVFKIGPRLLLDGGSEVIRSIKEKGSEVFLDLKLHDIPNTVRLAVEKARELGINYMTLHSLGGTEMMESAVDSSGELKLLGVTLLTSHGEDYLEYVKTSFGGVKEMTLYLAKRCKEVGLFGVVCSGWEVKDIKESTGLYTVVPGIRLSSSRDDQHRVYTPRRAVEEGADMLVMGRDIYRSDNPRRVVEEVLEIIS